MFQHFKDCLRAFVDFSKKGQNLSRYFEAENISKTKQNPQVFPAYKKSNYILFYCVLLQQWEPLWWNVTEQLLYGDLK